MTIDQVQPSNPTIATDMLLAHASPLAIYALMLRSLTVALHEHWSFFSGLLPDDVGDEVFDKKVPDACRTILDVLSEIASSASHPGMNCTAENFRNYTDDRHVAAHVKNLQEAIAVFAKIDKWHERGMKDVA